MSKESCGMAKAWEATLRKTQAAAKKRAHSIFGSMSIAHVNDDFDDDISIHSSTSYHTASTTTATPSTTAENEPHHVEKFLPNGDYYTGQWFDNCPHGHGKYLWTDGCMYVGEWFRGQSIGKGRFSWPSGATYEGEFKSGYMDGKGTHIGPNGDTYRGFWVMNQKHGQGTMKHENGDCYEGEWRHGVQEGHGKYQWKNGNHYLGEWRNGMINGRGTMVWSNGNGYEGYWQDGLPKGDGIFRWINGSYYEGTWSNDPKEHACTYSPSETADRDRENSNFDLAETIYDQISADCKICPADPMISVYPSQKKLATWKSSKASDHRVRPGRMSVDSRLNPSSTDRPWDHVEGSFSSDGSNRISFGDRCMDLEGLNLENTRTSPGRPLRIPKAGKKQGEAITRAHKNYELMLNLQLGIRHAVGRQAPPTSLDLKSSAFDPKEKVWTKFPTEGSKYTPPHNSCEFKWKDYCPLVFRALRKLFKIDAADYMLSICGNDALRELSSPGKSGSFFYLSHDDRYMIKTIKKAEVKVNTEPPGSILRSDHHLINC